ncbi:MAG: hypothetical protein IID44_22095 [Planctomycetes bacterium]|nr:hypothetical protein [Planctomycetota bacterium]
MSWFSNFLLLAAEADAEVEKSFMDYAPLIGVLLAIAVVPFVLGKVVSNSLRMADYRWKIRLIFYTVLTGSVVVFLGVKNDAIRLAIDLKGGTRLIYEVDEEQRLRDGLDEAVIKIKQTFGTDEDDDELSVGSPAVGEIRIEVPADNEELNQRIEAETADLEIQGGSLVLTLDHVEDVGSMRHHIYKLVAVTEGSGQMDKLADAVARRINPSGVLEIIIRPAGYGRLEIVIPVTADENQEEVDSIKRKISTAGVLVFRILADENNSEHDRAIRRAKDEEKRGNKDRDVRAGLRTIARWVEVDLQVGEEKKDGTVQIDRNNVLRTVGEKTEVLVIIDRYNVTGGYLASASSGMSSTEGLAVNFTFKPAGAKRFGWLTKDNLPDESVVPVRYSRLGIVLDGELLSAPNINGVITDKGQITGQFNKKSIKFLVGVLNAGSLPTALHERPISEQKMSATQGADLIRRGMMSMAASLIAVFVFMLIYYRFSGIVACFALMLNLLLILQSPKLKKKVLFIPGIIWRLIRS